MAAVTRRYSKEEIAHRGDTLYASVVAPRLTDADNGRFVALDIDSGEFEIDDEELAACDRLRARLPDAQIWLVRVGSRYVHRCGAGEIHPEIRRCGSGAGFYSDFFCAR